MKKIFKVLGLILFAVIFVETFVFLWKKSRPSEITYEVVTVAVGDLEKKTVATGKIEARNEIQIKPQIAGIVSEILKEAGQTVRRDEVIARIKVIPDMVALNAAETRVGVAIINLKQAETEYLRQKELFGKNVVSREDFEKSQVTFKSAEEEWESAKDNLALVRDGITEKNGAQSNTLIRSTIDGMVLDVPVKVGNSVIQANNFNEGTTVAIIANMKDMQFVGKVDETEVGKLCKGLPLTLSIGALNDRKVDAQLEYISPKGTEENGATLFEIKAVAKIPDRVFVRSGYSANAEIVLDRVKNVVLIPESTVEFVRDTAFVQVLKTERPQTFERRIIRTGLTDGIRIEVISGLKSGEKIRGNAVDSKEKK